MIRRYDMTRSDNAPLGSRCMMPCKEGDGSFMVYVGFLVSSAMVTPVRVPDGCRLFIDESSFGDTSFRIIYENVPKGVQALEFSFVAQ